MAMALIGSRGTRRSILSSARPEGEAGYTVLEEQVVPEFCNVQTDSDGQPKFQGARLDVELFLHPVAPGWLVDGTVRHPTAQTHRRSAAAQPGAAEKARRYPPRGGKEVLCCAAETFGFIDEAFSCFLDELAVLAVGRQRARGVKPTRWGARWRTLLSLRLACSVATAILRSV